MTDRETLARAVAAEIALQRRVRRRARAMRRSGQLEPSNEISEVELTGSDARQPALNGLARARNERRREERRELGNHYDGRCEACVHRKRWCGFSHHAGKFARGPYAEKRDLSKAKPRVAVDADVERQGKGRATTKITEKPQKTLNKVNRASC